MNSDEELAKAAAEALERPSDAAFWGEGMYTTHGPVISWADRSDDLLAESNFKMVREYLQGVAAATEHYDADCCWDGESKKGYATAHQPHDGDVFDASVSHWAVGSMQQVWVRVYEERCYNCDAEIEHGTGDVFYALEGGDRTHCGAEEDSWHVGDYTEAFIAAVEAMLKLRDDYPIFDEDDYNERESEATEEAITDAFDMAVRLLDDDARGDLDDERVTAIAAEVRDSEDFTDDYPCRSDDVDYEEIGRMVTKAAAAESGGLWEAYARTLHLAQPETLFPGV